MKKVFFLAVILLSMTSCEREISGLETEKNENHKLIQTSRTTAKEQAKTGEKLVSDVDPKDIILPPKR